MPDDLKIPSSTEEEIQELETLVHENIKLAQDTNKVLHSMRRWARLSFWFKVILWIIVLGLPTILLYAYITPLMKLLPGASATSTPSTIFGLPSPSAVEMEINKMIHPSS